MDCCVVVVEMAGAAREERKECDRGRAMKRFQGVKWRQRLQVETRGRVCARRGRPIGGELSVEAHAGRGGGRVEEERERARARGEEACGKPAELPLARKRNDG